MPRKARILVGNSTDRKKAELFNSIDDLVEKGYNQDAIEHLEYLYRTTPSLKKHIFLKIGKVYTKMVQPQKALFYLQKIIPNSSFEVNQLIVENLMIINKKQAIMFIARSGLPLYQKIRLLKKYGLITESLENNEPVNLQCLKCSSFLFFLNGKLTCLTCKS